MFGARFFGARQFGRRYYGKAGVTIAGTYFGGRFFSARMFGERYWSADPGAASTTPGTLFGGRYWGIRHFGRRYFGTKGAPGFVVAQTAAIGLAGTLNLGSSAFAFGADKAVTQTAALGLNATLGVSGALAFDSGGEFCFTPPLDLPGLTGNVLLGGDLVIGIGGPVVPGSYWGRRYWGNRFFGGRYFGRPPGYSIAATGAIGLTGAVGLAGGISLGALSATFAPLDMAGTVGLAGDLTFGSPVIEPPRAPDGGGGGKQPRVQPPPRPAWARTAADQTDVELANTQLLQALQALVMSGALD